MSAARSVDDRSALCTIKKRIRRDAGNLRGLSRLGPPTKLPLATRDAYWRREPGPLVKRQLLPPCGGGREGGPSRDKPSREAAGRLSEYPLPTLPASGREHLRRSRLPSSTQCASRVQGARESQALRYSFVITNSRWPSASA